MSADSVEMVMYLPSYTSAFLADTGPFTGELRQSFGAMQAIAIVQLMEFANRYVLDDGIILYGANTAFAGGERDWGHFLGFLHKEVIHAGTVVEIPPKSFGYSWSLGKDDVRKPAEDTDPVLHWIYRELGDCRFSKLSEFSTFPRPNHIRAMHLLMLLSDYKSHDVVLDPMCGGYAIKQYPSFIKSVGAMQVDRKPFHPEFDEFTEMFVQSMRQPVSTKDIQLLRQPSFLLEALRQSNTTEGIFNVLRDFRSSSAASTYREANRIRQYASNLRERREAQTTLRKQVDEGYSSIGIKSRVPQWMVNTIGLSAAAIALLFHNAAPAAAMVLPAVLTGDFIHQHYLTYRSNVFTEFFDDEADLFTELERVFKGLLCSREQLAEELAKRQTITNKVVGAL